MERYLNRFYNIIDKIGKQNFILIVFIIMVIALTGIYQTFSIYTEMTGPTLIDNIETYAFILNANNTTNSVTVPANNSKNIDITINNESSVELLYGLYYSTNNSDIKIGYLEDRTASLPSDNIGANTNKVITIKIDNDSEYNASITFGVKYGFADGGDLNLDSGQSWLDVYHEEIIFFVSVGGTIEELTIEKGKTIADISAHIDLNNNYYFEITGARAYHYSMEPGYFDCTLPETTVIQKGATYEYEFTEFAS